MHGRTHRQSRRGSFLSFTDVYFCCALADVLVLVQMLDDLLVAVESETQVVDIGRVSGFMQKVKSTQARLLADLFSELTPVQCNLQVRDGVI